MSVTDKLIYEEYNHISVMSSADFSAIF
jgi:hypothetical protein